MIGKTQLSVVNSRIRQLFQKHYEFGVLKKHLRRNHIDLNGKVILDAGCGSGFSTELIASEFQPAELHALDIMPEQVELARQRGLAADVSVGDIAATQFPSDTFDAVFTFGVFHHVPAWFTALEEVNRVLKPGGVLLGGEINRQESLGFEWAQFATDLRAAGFDLLEDEKIYGGYFRSFVCRKPDIKDMGSPSPTAQARSEATRGPTFDRSTRRWITLFALVFAVILIPFFLFGSQIERWTEAFIESASGQPGWVAVVLGSLLASDILLPVPSSLISTAAGFLLGFTRGMITSLVGMTVSCAMGFWLGVRFGRLIACRLVGESELERLEKMSHRFGNWVIVVARPVPMLAEASVLFAGISRMPIGQFLLLSTLSNLGISAVYAAVGALSATANSFLLAFAGAIVIPLIAMLAKGDAKGDAKEKR
jgi:uncharacterized membrane protein YdjX (TVP38/TMEM64 family)